MGSRTSLGARGPGDCVVDLSIGTGLYNLHFDWLRFVFIGFFLAIANYPYLFITCYIHNVKLSCCTYKYVQLLCSNIKVNR